MAIIKFGEIVRGRLGNKVYYKLKGKTCIRSLPLTYNDANTPRQQAQRQRMKVALEFLRKFKDLVRITYITEGTCLAFQAAQSQIMRNALTGEYPDISVDKSKALISMGPLPLPLRAWLITGVDGFSVQWENGVEASGSAIGHLLMVIVLYSDDTHCSFNLTNTSRGECMFYWNTARPLLPESLPDVWIAFYNKGMTKMSNSMKVEWD